MEQLSNRIVETWVKLESWRKSEEGQGLVEYGLIIAIVSIALILVLGGMTTELRGTFTTITNTLSSAKTPS